jgi:hypothetical protein
MTAERIDEAFASRDLAGAAWDLDAGTRTLKVTAVVPNAAASALSQDLGLRVVSAGQGDDPYWSSGTSGALPLVIGETR